MTEPWIWILAGMTPYYISRKWLGDGGWRVVVSALFWTLQVQHCGHYDWIIRVPLIERLSDTIWAAVLQIRRDRPVHNDKHPLM
jgi:hypothetical protein